ncbi:hypothetical protein TSACC_2893 [Terrimicrobium sacchariphilum]|uniref:Uncharacterized protein n=1 Tax=Terrimicrobium sacchariphilum TaxID=690879 RepID=A0A146G6C3_TERSA|nr:hypothetical protein [Terrimicrobium sacchariphilum]GAT32494.1 hypothetical protein TSACC_2893 [Terrimicrobium sacchariphilum]
MKRFSPLLAAVLVALAAPALAQDISAQKAIYQKAEKNLASCKKVCGSSEYGDALVGWVDEDGSLIKVTANSSGRSEDYYPGPDGKLAYVHLDWGDDDHRVKESIYFTPTAIVKWLANGENSDESPEELKESFATFQKNFATYSHILLPDQAAEPASASPTKPATQPAAQSASESAADSASEESAGKTFASAGKGDIKGSTLNVTEGKFLRIDEGDYFHWVMKDKETGEEVDYFIIKPDANVEAVTDAPEKFVGKKCRVTWKESTENLPEAGGKQDVQQILSVTWIK